MALLIRVDCAECSKELSVTTTPAPGSEDMIIEVTPCGDCRDKAYETGFDEGKDAQNGNDS
jgi:hypothetical protein